MTAEMDALLERRNAELTNALLRALNPPKEPTLKDEMAGEFVPELIKVTEELQDFARAIDELECGKADPLTLPTAYLQTSFMKRTSLPNIRSLRRGNWIAVYKIDPDKSLCEGLYIIERDGTPYKQIRKLIL